MKQKNCVYCDDELSLSYYEGEDDYYCCETCAAYQLLQNEDGTFFDMEDDTIIYNRVVLKPEQIVDSRIGVGEAGPFSIANKSMPPYFLQEAREEVINIQDNKLYFFKDGDDIAALEGSELRLKLKEDFKTYTLEEFFKLNEILELHKNTLAKLKEAGQFGLDYEQILEDFFIQVKDILDKKENL